MDTIREIQQRLLSMQDEGYREFNRRLLPTVPPEAVIGVRTPALRKLAKELGRNTGAARDFLDALPHRYFEENNLHAFLLEQVRDFDECLARVNVFLPYIDNWATCDQLSPKVFGRHLPRLLDAIKLWLVSGHCYTVRFGIGMLMRWYLDDAFDVSYADMVAAVDSEEYYIRMMAAWYFATALAKQYDAVLPYIEQRRLPGWTHNKTIQKAVESYRLSEEQKAHLRTLRR